MDFCHTNLIFTSSCIMFHVKSQILLDTPIVIEDMICFLIYKHIDVSKFEAYRAIDSILNKRTFTILSIDMALIFISTLKLLAVVQSQNNGWHFFNFIINKTVAFNHHGILKTDLGRTQSYNYKLKPASAPIYSYTQSLYNRETINLDEYTSLLNETGDKSRRRKTINIFRNLIKCVFL